MHEGVGKEGVVTARDRGRHGVGDAGCATEGGRMCVRGKKEKIRSEEVKCVRVCRGRKEEAECVMLG